MKNIYIISFVIALAIFGSYFFPRPTTVVKQVLGSAAGTTYGSPRAAYVVMAPVTGATSTSILNTDDSARYITSSFVACNGTSTVTKANTNTGIASWIWTMSTTSSGSLTGALADTNSNYAANIPIGTTTQVNFIASSTEGVIQGTSRAWPSATYLTIQTNGTSTAVCVAGVHYIGS